MPRAEFYYYDDWGLGLSGSEDQTQEGAKGRLEDGKKVVILNPRNGEMRSIERNAVGGGDTKTTSHRIRQAV